MQIVDFQHKFPKIGHELFRNLFLEIRGTLMEIRVEEKKWDFVFDRMNVFAMQIIDFQHKYP